MAETANAFGRKMVIGMREIYYPRVKKNDVVDESLEGEWKEVKKALGNAWSTPQTSINTFNESAKRERCKLPAQKRKTDCDVRKRGAE